MTFEFFETGRYALETVQTLCKRAQIMQLVPPNNLQPVTERTPDFLKTPYGNEMELFCYKMALLKTFFTTKIA